MFGNLFRKTEPKVWLVEQRGHTTVLLLPAKFQNNDVLNQQFTHQERRKLHKIFEEEGILHVFEDQAGMDGDADYVRFQADFVNTGEIFFSKSDDLSMDDRHVFDPNEEIEAEDWYEVREFEFFISK